MVRRRTVLAALTAGGATTAGCATVTAATPTPAVHHQLGVLTAPPAAGIFAAYDVTAGGLEPVFRALGTETAGVEITVGVGAALFDHRFGLAGKAPRHLTAMPSFPNDVLNPALCHGDILVQACSADRKAADAALQRITAVAGQRLRPRWRVDGFREQNTPTADGHASNRDLFGFREGAGNPDVRDAALMNDLVWVPAGSDEPGWTAGGSYQVVRQIRFAPALWDAEPTAKQESVIGRRKTDGAPLGHDREDATFDYHADPGGQQIALDSHIRRANPRTPATQANRILRRGYSYRRGVDPAGQPDEGLIFVCFQRNLAAGFATVQRRLAGQALDKYVLPAGGGYFFVLAGRGDGYLGQSLVSAAAK